MSDPTGPVASPEFERRDRRGLALARAVYLGIPVVFFGLLCWISAAAAPELGFNWQVLLVPLAMLAINLRLLRKNRYRPSRWAFAGLACGGITGIVVAFYTIVLDFDWLPRLFIVAGLVGALIGRAIGAAGNRVISYPADPELADSSYELVYRLRTPPNILLEITKERVHVKELVLRGSGTDQSTVGVGPDYRIDWVTGTHEVSLSGAERLKFPLNLRTRPMSSPGPALILQFKGVDWVLPINHAGGLAALIARRAETRRRVVQQETLAAHEAEASTAEGSTAEAETPTTESPTSESPASEDQAQDRDS
ncbi:hypothetical protein OG394_25640 [Kribbella sp. NBC_01245]|uniref:hypothetical protein n=1 Tax=Kribbella sp. NBC_01245 TaxID=2903578 RepID=UPI002E2C7973|nr:hypothetical protein [Kribbella sp. NBC_01245]